MERRQEEALQRVTHQPMLVVCDLMTENPDSNKKALVARKQRQQWQMSSERGYNMPSHLSNNARSLGIQRKMLPISGPKRPRSSHLIFSSFPQMQLKIFYLTMPIWLDRGRMKTFPVLVDFVERNKHVQNHCPQALSMCHFSERHDAVLEVI